MKSQQTKTNLTKRTVSILLSIIFMFSAIIQTFPAVHAAPSEVIPADTVLSDDNPLKIVFTLADGTEIKDGSVIPDKSKVQYRLDGVMSNLKGFQAEVWYSIPLDPTKTVILDTVPSGIMKSGNIDCGEYCIENDTYYFKLDKSYVDSQGHSDIKFWVQQNGTINFDSDGGNTQQVGIKDVIYEVKPDLNTNVVLGKKATHISGNDYLFTVEIIANNGNVTIDKIEDSWGKYLIGTAENLSSVTATDSQGNSYTFSGEISGNNCTFTPDSTVILPADTTLTLTYQMTVSDEYFSDSSSFENDVQNNAKVTGHDDNDKTLGNSGGATAPVTKSSITKTGSLNEESKTVTWTIKVIPGQNEDDLSKLSVSDILGENLSYSGDLDLSNISLSDFEEHTDDNGTYYTLSYDTSVDESIFDSFMSHTVKNSAVLNKETDDGSKVQIGMTEGSASTNGVGISSEKNPVPYSYDADRGTIEWEISANIPEGCKKYEIWDNNYSGNCDFSGYENGSLSFEDDVKVTAGGAILEYGVDYTAVYYNMGLKVVMTEAGLEKAVNQKLVIRFASGVKPGYDPATSSIENQANISYGDGNSSTDESTPISRYYYPELVVKGDGKVIDGSGNKVKLPDGTEFKKEGNELVWTILIDKSAVLDENQKLKTSGSVSISDYLPSGLKYVDGSATVGLYFDFQYGQTSINNGGYNWQTVPDMYEGAAEALNVSSDGQTINFNYDPSNSSKWISALTALNDGATIDNTSIESDAFKGITIIYKTEVEDASSWLLESSSHSQKQNFTNVIDYTIDDVNGRTSFTQEYDAGKDVDMVDKGLTWDGNKANFTLTVNKSASKLSTQSNGMITLVDNMKLSSDNAVNIDLDPSSIEVYGNDSLLSSSEYSYTYDSAAKTIVFTLPDEMKIDIKYTINAIGSTGSLCSYTNDAYIKGYKEIQGTTGESVDVRHYLTASSESGAIGNHVILQITKYGTGSPPEKLSGVKFEISKYSDPTDSYVTDETNLNGQVIIGGDKYNIQADTLYHLVEINTPAGYKPVDIYLIFYGQDAETAKDNIPDEIKNTPGKLKEFNLKGANNVEIKSFSDILYDEPIDITVEKTYISELCKTAEFTFGLFDNADGTGEPIETKTLTMSGNSKGIKDTVTFEKLDASKEYYVFELDADGNAVPNGAFYTDKNGLTMHVQGINSYGQPIDLTLGDGKVSVTNKDDTAADVSIIKVGENSDGSTNPLPGASMKLTYTGDGSLSEVTADGDINISGNTITWESTDKQLTLSHIPNGDYVLEETAAPDGYEIATEITFSVIDGKVQNIKVGDTATSYEGVITMVDALKPVVTTTVTETTAVTTTTTVTTTTETTTEETESTTETTVMTVTSTVITVTETTTTTEVTTTETTVTTVTTEETTTTDSGATVAIIKIGENEDGGSDPLPGASMKLIYNGEGSLDKVTADGDISISDNTITWESSDKQLTLENVPDGEYVLQETAAPDGYEIATDITFSVIDGKVQNVKVGETETDYDGVITMFDALKPVETTTVTVTTAETTTTVTTTTTATETEQTESTTETTVMTVTSTVITVTETTTTTEVTTVTTVTTEETTTTDSGATVAIIKIGENEDGGSDPLPGASMKLTYNGEGSLDKVTADGDINISDNTITWESSDKQLTLENIPDGDYVLQETAAPDGYEIATDITFSVIDGKVQNVKIGETETDYDGVITMFDALKPVETTTVTVTTAETTNTTVTTTTTAATTEETEITTVTTVITVTSTVVTTETETTTSTTVTTKETETTTTESIVTVAIIKIGENEDGSSDPLPGASMKLIYNGEGSLDKVTADGDINISGNIITWESTDKQLTLENIPDGDYVLQETAAPDGYEIATDITFSVIDGKVQNVKIGETETDYDGVITMFDALKPVETTTVTVTTAETTNTTVTTTTTAATTEETEITTVTTIITVTSTVVTTETETTTTEVTTTVTTTETSVTTVTSTPVTETTILTVTSSIVTTTQTTTETTKVTTTTTVTTTTEATEPTEEETTTTEATEPTEEETTTTEATEPTEEETTATEATEPTEEETTTTEATEPTEEETTATEVTEPTEEETTTTEATEPTEEETTTTEATEPTEEETTTTEATEPTEITDVTTETTASETTVVSTETSTTETTIRTGLLPETIHKTTSTTTSTSTSETTATTTSTTSSTAAPITTTTVQTTAKLPATTNRPTGAPKTGDRGIRTVTAGFILSSVLIAGCLITKKRRR